MSRTTSIFDATATPLRSIPVHNSPRARSFGAFAGSSPTPPPPSCLTSVLTPEQQAWHAWNAAWVARQRAYYAMPGSGPLTSWNRGWNGRVDLSSSDSNNNYTRIGRIGNLLTRPARIVKSLSRSTSAYLRAKAADTRRALAARHAQLSFWAGRANYHLIRCRRATVIELREIVARTQLVLLIGLFIFGVGLVTVNAAELILNPYADRYLNGDVVYVFVKDPRVWSVAGLS
ncbi:hypothetical protein F5Y19DRAFT_199314 [Xylariaceae sp. FL1651]|nr:hypothetical protein F5Y19DRAFT_199314 [Xylariaceae sp. FL1651]